MLDSTAGFSPWNTSAASGFNDGRQRYGGGGGVDPIADRFPDEGKDLKFALHCLLCGLLPI